MVLGHSPESGKTFHKSPQPLDISLDQTSLEPVDFEPPICMVFTQHACHIFFRKEKIVKEINRNVPSLLCCEKTSKYCIWMRLRIFVRSFQGLCRPFDHNTFLLKTRELLTLLNKAFSLLNDRSHQVWKGLPLDDDLIFHAQESVISNKQPLVNCPCEPVRESFEFVAHVLRRIDDDRGPGNPDCFSILSHSEGCLRGRDGRSVAILFERLKNLEGSPSTPWALYRLRRHCKVNRVLTFVTDCLCPPRNVTQPDVGQRREGFLISGDRILFDFVTCRAKDEGRQSFNLTRRIIERPRPPRLNKVTTAITRKSKILHPFPDRLLLILFPEGPAPAGRRHSPNPFTLGYSTSHSARLRKEGDHSVSRLCCRAHALPF